MTEMRVDAETGSEFAADEVSVSHSPLRFVVDFKSITPRVDMNNQAPRLVVKHSVVKLEPFLMKELLSVISDNIRKFEEKFGKIERPKSLVAAEKQAKKENKDKPEQSYFG